SSGLLDNLTIGVFSRVCRVSPLCRPPGRTCAPRGSQRAMCRKRTSGECWQGQAHPRIARLSSSWFSGDKPTFHSEYSEPACNVADQVPRMLDSFSPQTWLITLTPSTLAPSPSGREIVVSFSHCQTGARQFNSPTCRETS